MFCVHCSHRRAARPRRLCFACYENRSVRERYPRQSTAQFEAVSDYCGRSPLPQHPTAFGPGTEGKIAVLQERASRGEALWHPLDARER